MRWRIRPLQAQPALLYAAARERLVRLFLGSSAVEHPTVNRMVAGSNPARGAKFRFIFNDLRAPSDAALDVARLISQALSRPNARAESHSSGCVRQRRQIDLIQVERHGAGLLRS